MNEHRSPGSVGYREDFYAWTQHQAKLLRALGKFGSNFPEDLDLEHVAEEIDGLGSADLNSVKSYIRQIMIHLIKAASEPKSRALRHWASEATGFNSDLLDRYTPSMRQSIDVQLLWTRALRDAKLQLQEHDIELSPALISECPYSVEDMTTDDFNFDQLLTQLSGAD